MWHFRTSITVSNTMVSKCSHYWWFSNCSKPYFLYGDSLIGGREEERGRRPQKEKSRFDSEISYFSENCDTWVSDSLQNTIENLDCVLRTDYRVFFNCLPENTITEVKLPNTELLRKPSKAKRVKYLLSGCNLEATLKQVGNSCRMSGWLYF